MYQATVYVAATIVAYLFIVLGVGFFYAKRNESSSDFYLGGRTLGPLVAAMSAEASDMSGWLLMGLPGVAYLAGTAEAGWTVIGLAVGTYLNWLFTARRLRRYTAETGSFTIPQFFSRRYKDDKCVLTLIAALVIIIFFIPYTASGFAACGKLFSSLFGFDYTVAMMISAVVIISYTTAGGFLAASMTDFIQSIVMTIAIVSVCAFAVHVAGGVQVVAENAKSMAGYLAMTSTVGEKGVEPYGFLTILATLSWGFGYFGMPHILLRFMAIDDEKHIKLSRRVASIWVVIAMAIAIGIGIVGRVLANKGIITLAGDSETVIVSIAHYMSGFGVLAAIAGGIVLAGILASTMSTADSQLLAAASGVSENLVRETFKINISERNTLLIARLTVIVIAILGMVIARDPNSSVFRIISFAWAGFGAAFGPVMLCSLFWRRANLPGAVAGMVCGGAMVFIWKFLLKPMGGIWGIYELLPAFIVGLLAIFIVSLCTKEPDPEITEVFDKVAKG
ncbi:MAG: sodium/proline symporter [Abditibacteriota bacterium]|nr:sodium/proline symporter [Abditibacteriota bacterium]MBP5093763.1 sodium/proline symporter [Abditibacteriota bacterium]MBP5738548.1 sodium/proline symporter [Abditibacteriota bacterium]